MGQALKYFLVVLILLLAVLYHAVLAVYVTPQNPAPPLTDIVLHALGGLWLSAAAVYYLYHLRGIGGQLKFWEALFVILGFVALIGVCWELYEYIGNLYAQVLQEPIDDTFSDLAVELISGTLFFSIYRVITPRK
jgi:hypothetical protein